MEDSQINQIGNIVVVKVDPVSATLRDAQPFWEEFEKNNLFDHNKIIIDISCCVHIDSTFMGMIVKIFKKVNGNNGQLKLVFPQLSSIDSFRISGITKVLECFDTLEEALAMLRLNLSVNDLLLKEEISRN
ncbi:MAG TPA: STAS domain-containing protein [Ignavibacteriaceae bacterium]